MKFRVASCAREPAGGGALLRRSEDHHAVRAEIRAQVDQVADVLPTARAQRRVRRGHVQALGAHHQPVQPDELEPFGRHDVAVFAALLRGDVPGPFRERERGDLDPGIPGLPDRPAGILKFPAFKRFVANRLAETIIHESSSLR